jgi:uncharacterized protein with HEPN domain
MKEDLIYLEHILQSINRIEGYLSDVNLHDYTNNLLLQDGITRQLEIIGEAAKHLSEDTIKLKPDIPWKDIVGMRNKLSHDYFGIDIDTIWETATDDLPYIKPIIEELINLLNK